MLYSLLYPRTTHHFHSSPTLRTAATRRAVSCIVGAFLCTVGVQQFSRLIRSRSSADWGRCCWWGCPHHGTLPQRGVWENLLLESHVQSSVM